MHRCLAGSVRMSEREGRVLDLGDVSLLGWWVLFRCCAGLGSGEGGLSGLGMDVVVVWCGLVRFDVSLFSSPLLTSGLCGGVVPVCVHGDRCGFLAFFVWGIFLSSRRLGRMTIELQSVGGGVCHFCFAIAHFRSNNSYTVPPHFPQRGLSAPPGRSVSCSMFDSGFGRRGRTDRRDERGMRMGLGCWSTPQQRTDSGGALLAGLK